MKSWGKEETDKLKEMYPFIQNNILAIIFNKTQSSIEKKAWRLGIKKNEEFLSAIKSFAREGEKCISWKGGRKKTLKGYIMILDKNNPNSDKSGYVLEHRKVMSEHLRRPLRNDEIVHHINGNKTDNRVENLEVTNWSDHTIHHHTGTKRSIETKMKISTMAKKRLENKESHPLYKHIDVDELIRDRNSGMMVKEICKLHGICTRTYYNKIGR